MRLSNRLLSLTLAAMVGATAGMPLQVKADDTDIYLGDGAIGEGVLPNVVFILDTSGSMGNYDGYPKDRMDRMKDALYEILDGTNNVNVGLMRFSDPGGPVLFPAANINADANAVETGGQVDVSVQIADPNDDVEEKNGDMLLTSNQIDLVHTDAFGPETSLVVQVVDGADDAEQTASWYRYDSTQMEMTDNSSGNRTNGIRFQDVDIANGATILAATIDFYSRDDRSDDADLTVRGHDIGDSLAFRTTNQPGTNDVYSRLGALTSATVDWSDVEDWVDGDRHFSPDLSPIVSEIVSHPQWATGNAMTFIFTGTEDSRRDVATYEYNGGVHAPFLRIDVADPGATSGDQKIGVRFQDVRVPQGVTITSAKIEFTAAQTDTASADLIIYGEDTASAAAFTSASNNVSNRTRTSASVPWPVDAWDTTDTAEQTPDITSVVQEIVDRSDWCGGQDMAFIIEKDLNSGPRRAHSADGDPSRAPILRIEYDENSSLLPGEGCIIQTLQVQVAGSKDDAQERNNNVNRSNAQMAMSPSGRVNGIRFRNLDITQGAQIISAKVSFRARKSDSGSTTINFAGHDVADSPQFSNQSPKITGRSTTTATVAWNAPSWSQDAWYESPELATILTEIVAGPGWEAGNDVSFILSGSGRRRAHTYDSNPSYAAILNVTMQGFVSTDTNTSLTTVRERLKEIVSDLSHAGYTPIVDTLYEAGLYYQGEAVDYGRTRGDGGSTVERNTRVSHPASYTGGTLHQPNGCDDTDLSAEACRNEQILNDPVYTSPIEQSCQTNYIVLLTDGVANHNHSEGKIKSMTGLSSCQSTFNNGESVSGGERCAVDLVNWMYENDMRNSVIGTNNVATYTIGFNISNQFLTEMATAGGGKFYEAESSAELASVFQQIVAEVSAKTVSFAAPSVGVNAFNRLNHRGDVYFSFFQPSEEVKWAGNVKKYQLCDDANSCELGSVLDARDPDPQPAIGNDNRIDDDAISFWSAEVDGSKITVGGAGGALPAHSNRVIYTYTGATSPSNVDLSLDEHRLISTNDDVTKEMLGGSDTSGDPNYMTDSTRADLIDWIRGRDVDDEDGDSDVSENRYAFADPLHSSPVAVTYGCEDTDGNLYNCSDDETPVIKLFVGTNDGALHMLNANTGAEEWAFIPQQMLEAQANLRENLTGAHIYGMDLTSTVWVNDENSDGTIDPTVDSDGDGIKEFVRVYAGMRRGGNSLFALVATPINVLSNPNVTNGVKPRLLWRIDGGGDDFPRLGQTWSQPKLINIAYGTDEAGHSQSKYVLAFAGGYDDAQDETFDDTGMGNAIYFVDPADGSLLFWISGVGTHTLNADIGAEVTGMDYPIPSALTVLDSNNDGLTDRIYVGDTGGQLWRADLRADLSDSAGIKATVGMIATVSDDAAESDKRKFFYAPAVLSLRNEEYSSQGNYDLIVITTGDRANPLETLVQNRFFAFRDWHTGNFIDANADNMADGLTTIQGKTEATPSNDLIDLTDIIDVTDDEDNLTLLESSSGYYIDLETVGEKGLSSPIVLSNTVFFTSYVPALEAAAETCSLAEGGALLYGFNVLSGEPVYDWDTTDGCDKCTKGDRSQFVGAGIPSKPIAVFQEQGVTLLIGVAGGGDKPDVALTLPKFRSFWFNQTN